jgi:hypothetical protein
MPRFTTAIAIGGQRVEHPPTEKTAAWRLANCVFCPLGPAPMQAWFVMTRLALDGLDKEAAHTIVWDQITSDGSADVSLSFPGLYIAKAERLMHGGPGDPNALYLVEFADGRHIAAKNSDSGVVQVNLRSYANSADYLAGTSGGTWASLVESLWTACGTLGAFPGLPFAPDGVPQNTWLIGLNAYRSLNAVLEQLDCAIARDPFSGTFSIVQLGAAQTIPDNSTTLQWNSEPLTNNVTQAAANLKFYHYFHYKAYGQERDAELSNNWAVNSGGPTAMPTGLAGASGTLALWDDLPVILDEDGNATNTAAVDARDAARLARYQARFGVTNQHRIHWGLTTDFATGGKIRAVLWRNFGDGEESDLGGTVTEFVCKPGLITGFRMTDHGAAWLDAQLAAPEREQYSPPDVGRHSYPNYPRLPNIVQVNHLGAQSGDSIDPDVLTSTGVSLHSGRVKRWVANGMATLDNCWILFVDGYDAVGGNVKAVQGEYYGPARLSGVSTCSSLMLPVYTVRNGSPQAQKFEVVFELTSALALAGIAAARICTINPATGDYVANGDPIVVVDFYRNPGMWQGEIGHRGIGVKRSDGKYDVTYMERPALFTGAIFDRESPGDAFGHPVDQPAVIGLPNYFQHGEKIPPGPLVTHDPNGFYPRALTGGQVLSAWNDVNVRREMVVAQQQGIYADAQLKTTLAYETEDISVEEFEIESFSPFNLKPWDIANTTVVNFLHLHGEAGDYCVLLWLEAYGKWLLLAVNQDQRDVEFVTLSPTTGAESFNRPERLSEQPFSTGEPSSVLTRRSTSRDHASYSSSTTKTPRRWSLSSERTMDRRSGQAWST